MKELGKKSLVILSKSSVDAEEILEKTTQKAGICAENKSGFISSFVCIGDEVTHCSGRTCG